MAPQQKGFYVQGAVAWFILMGVVLLLRPPVEGRVDDSGDAAGHFLPVGMGFFFPPPVRTDGLPLFAYHQPADILRVFKYLPDRGISPAGVRCFRPASSPLSGHLPVLL